MQTPQDYIRAERLKAKYYQKFGDFDSRQLSDYLKKLPTEKDRKIAEAIWKDRNNQSLSEIWERTTQNYREQLLIGLVNNAQLQKLVKETYLGVLPTGDVNAFAKYAENGEKMVILNEGLLHTIHYWSSFFLRTLDDGNDNFFWDDEKMRNDSLKWIYHVWNNKNSPDIEVPNIFPKTADSWKLAQVLTFSGIVFVIAHEFGHLLHDHKGYSKDRLTNHQMEYDADKIGMEVALKYSIVRGTIAFPDDTFYTKFMLFGPYLVFNILALFGVNDSETHPSILNRLEKLNNGYDSYARDYLGDQKYKLFMESIDSDYFEKMQNISKKLMGRHLLYAAELGKLSEKWA